jgi:hypothetical protein
MEHREQMWSGNELGGPLLTAEKRATRSFIENGGQNLVLLN